MADAITEQLTKKVGPLPLGVWIIAGGAGVAIAVYMRRQSAAQDQTPTETDTSDWNLGGNTDTPAGVGGSAGGGGSVPPLPTAPADNDEWFRRASDALVARGMSGTVVNAALGHFLSGESLSDQDRAIVDAAIRAEGNPPVAPPPAPNKPPNPPTIPPRSIPEMPGTPGKPKPKPVPGVDYFQHTVLPGQNIATIAKKYNTTQGRVFASNAVGFRRLDGTTGTLRQYSDVKAPVRLIIPRAIIGANT
jgi:hypothetical protein